MMVEWSSSGGSDGTRTRGLLRDRQATNRFLPLCPLDGTYHRAPSVFRASICPFQDCIQRWTERLSPFGQSVFHLRWNLRICGAMHNAVGLHAFQLLPQHLLCDAGNCTLKVGKTHNLAPEEMKENDELPSAFEQPQRCFNIGSRRGGCVALRHLAPNILFRAYFPLSQYGEKLLPVQLWRRPIMNNTRLFIPDEFKDKRVLVTGGTKGVASTSSSTVLEDLMLRMEAMPRSRKSTGKAH